MVFERRGGMWRRGWRLREGEKREECGRDVEIERKGIVGKGVKLGVFWSKEG